jgi:quinol-cytochrome oxidoreductase complex cytochrome b subunit
LIRFYAWHIFGLTLGTIILLAWHIFRVRRDGGIAVPPPPLRPDNQRITRYELVRREVLAMILTSAALILLSTFSPAPIAPQITEITALSGEALAPWFFLWVQEMLKWGDPFLLGILVPLFLLTILTLIPYILPKPKNRELGRWFIKSNRMAQITVVVITLFIILLTILGRLSGT